MFDLIFLFSQYHILATTAKYLSTLDLYHTALTCSDLNAAILRSSQVFKSLKRQALCDGHGLQARQCFSGPFAFPPACPADYDTLPFDSEVEVRLWRLKCDAVNALPCLKYHTNVYEECRFVPRIKHMFSWAEAAPRPQIHTNARDKKVIVYCEQCEPEMEVELRGACCDCDRYTRWICLPCKLKEDEEEIWYLKAMTRSDRDYQTIELFQEIDRLSASGFQLVDHLDRRYYWCPCGIPAPSTAQVRCIWCKRKHERYDPYEPYHNYDLESIVIANFDDDPCRPGSPPLGGPGWDDAFRRQRNHPSFSCL